jgi:hypothetical protein
MTLRRFLDAGYALLVEAWQGVGSQLLESIERADESLGLRAAGKPVAVTPSPVDNDRALAELNAMMAGVRKR